MPTTLLIGSSSHSWQPWLEENLGSSDFLCLEPSAPEQSPPGRLCLRRGSKVVAWRFHGSLDSMRAPHVVITALSKLLREAGDELVIQFPTFRPTPLFRQTLYCALEILRPDRILVAGIDPELGGYHLGAEIIEVSSVFPVMVTHAQRRAQWIKLVDETNDFIFLFDEIAIEGARFGSGEAVSARQLEQLKLQGLLHVEKLGTSLLVMAKNELTPEEILQICSHFEVARCVGVQPEDYWGMLCSFATGEGEDFAMGYVEKIDPVRRTLHIRATAVEGSKPKLLRLGTLRIDGLGNEKGESHPWRV